ncbi:unnamed protein product [Pleuronectes platessa]|uniref:Uncharacterized protein n=1 Tax=Pleuronectes platessa TaxID=8262 RepID=A0A9N7U1A8_PLEPL|nr:unnamed protein product [Pleuronectes platessa]
MRRGEGEEEEEEGVRIKKEKEELRGTEREAERLGRRGGAEEERRERRIRGGGVQSGVNSCDQRGLILHEPIDPQPHRHREHERSTSRPWKTNAPARPPHAARLRD